MTLTTVTSGKAAKLAKSILRLNENGLSYREISKRCFPSVPAGTLNRIAKSDGKWLPKGIEELKALGLVRERTPRRMTPGYMNNDDPAQSWILWMRELVKSIRTPTPKELAKHKSAWRPS